MNVVTDTLSLAKARGGVVPTKSGPEVCLHAKKSIAVIREHCTTVGLKTLKQDSVWEPA